jgi:phospholipid/cholesterol/gamma-HCH transport system ATP-binding protein
LGAEVVVEGLTKSFGRSTVWRDVALTIPQGELSVIIGPSGTGKTVFLKSLIGLVKPERGRILVDGTDVCTCTERQLYKVRKLFGVMFQDGALFGSMNLFDNIAFPLREHTHKTEAEIKSIVSEKMNMVGLAGDEKKFPGEISGGMKKRVGLARGLVLDPEIILCDEPDSGLDPVRTALLAQLLVDVNAQIDATIVTVTHNIEMTRTMPDNIGMLFRGELVMFGPREVLLTSEDPVITQFVNGEKEGPIGMSEEKDAALNARANGQLPGQGIAGDWDGPVHRPLAFVPQLETSPGMPPRSAVERRKERVMRNLHTLPPNAQRAIMDSLTPEERVMARRFAQVPAPAGGPRVTATPAAPAAPTFRPF